MIADPAAFFASLRNSKTLFGGKMTQGQVDGINGILQGFAETGDGLPSTLAYGLATGFHETKRAMIPNRENMNYTTAARIFKVYGPRRIASVAEAKQYVRQPQRLANKVYNGMLGNRSGTDDGWRYRGGGHMHLTGRANYAGSSRDAGVDLVARPEAILDPRISARVLFLGLRDGRWSKNGQGLPYYALGHADPKRAFLEAIEARQTVNGFDCAEDIAHYFNAFLQAIKAGGSPAQPVAAPDGHWISALFRGWFRRR